MSWESRLIRGDKPNLPSDKADAPPEKTKAQLEQEKKLAAEEAEVRHVHAEVVTPAIIRVQQLWGFGIISPTSYEIESDIFPTAKQDVKYLMTGEYDIPKEEKMWDSGERRNQGGQNGTGAWYTYKVHDGKWLIKRPKKVHIEGSISTFSGRTKRLNNINGSRSYEILLNDRHPALHQARTGIQLNSTDVTDGGSEGGGMRVSIDYRRLSEAREIIEENTYALMKNRYDSGLMPASFAGKVFFKTHDIRFWEPL